MGFTELGSGPRTEKTEEDIHTKLKQTNVLWSFQCMTGLIIHAMEQNPNYLASAAAVCTDKTASG